MNDVIGANIARLRKEKNMTQDQLANLMGISFQAVSKWENGLSSPDVSSFPMLADVFGVTIDELFGREAARLPPRSRRTTSCRGLMMTACTLCSITGIRLSAAATLPRTAG